MKVSEARVMSLPQNAPPYPSNSGATLVTHPEVSLHPVESSGGGSQVVISPADITSAQKKGKCATVTNWALPVNGIRADWKGATVSWEEGHRLLAGVKTLWMGAKCATTFTAGAGVTFVASPFWPIALATGGVIAGTTLAFSGVAAMEGAPEAAGYVAAGGLSLAAYVATLPAMLGAHTFKGLHMGICFLQRDVWNYCRDKDEAFDSSPQDLDAIEVEVQMFSPEGQLV
jgi:hypothetical protein